MNLELTSKKDISRTAQRIPKSLTPSLSNFLRRIQENYRWDISSPYSWRYVQFMKKIAFFWSLSRANFWTNALIKKALDTTLRLYVSYLTIKKKPLKTRLGLSKKIGKNCWVGSQKYCSAHKLSFLGAFRQEPASNVVALGERNRMVYNMSYLGKVRKKLALDTLRKFSKFSNFGS